MGWISAPEAWIALATLTLLEIVLGIDNIIFISIWVAKLPEKVRAKARYIGLSVAMFARIGLLLSLIWVMGLTDPLFAVLEHGFSGRDVILLGGGFTLMAEGFHQSIPKGYVYFAMAFSFVVEMLNLRSCKCRSAVKLHNPRKVRLEDMLDAD